MADPAFAIRTQASLPETVQLEQQGYALVNAQDLLRDNHIAQEFAEFANTYAQMEYQLRDILVITLRKTKAAMMARHDQP